MREQQADKPRLVVEVADEVWDGPRLTQRATHVPFQNMRIARLCRRSEGQVCNREWCDVTNGERSGA
jgi:hypothetical protein